MLAACCRADLIRLKNGDRVTGSIVKKDGGEVTVKTLHFGTVKVPWAEVEEVASDAPLQVVLPGGETLNGSLAPIGGAVEVRTGTENRRVLFADVEALRDAAEQEAYERLQSPRITDLWTVDGTVGLSTARGNAKNLSLNLPITATRSTREDKTNLYFNFVRASALVNGVEATTAQAIRGGWSYSRDLRSRFFWNAFNDYEHDRFQDLDLRVVLGTGLSVWIVKGERSRLEVVGVCPGTVRLLTRRVDGIVRNTGEAYWGDDWTYAMSQRASLIQSYRMFHSLQNSAAYRQNFDLSLATKLTKWLTWNTSVSDRYLNLPVARRQRNDLLLTTGLGFVLAK